MVAWFGSIEYFWTTCSEQRDQVHVAQRVRVRREELRVGGEDGEVPVGRERCPDHARRDLAVGGVETDPARRSGRAVSQEEVLGLVRIARDQVRRNRRKENVASVRGHPPELALAVALGTVGGNAEAACCLRTDIADDDVLHAIGVREVARRERELACGTKDGQAAVGRDERSFARCPVIRAFAVGIAARVFAYSRHCASKDVLHVCVEVLDRDLRRVHVLRS